MRNTVLKQKIKSFLTANAQQNQPFRDFRRSLDKEENFYIIGGAIRSIFCNRKPRDIDIIVKGSAHDIIRNLSGKTAIIENYFGGYKIDFDGITVDLKGYILHIV